MFLWSAKKLKGPFPGLESGQPLFKGPMHSIPPYPSVVWCRDADGQIVSEEYLVPAEKKADCLKIHYPFAEEPPRLDEQLFDLHEEKLFYVRDFKLVREHGLTLLVSPYYFESGGTVIDWAPADWAEPESPTEAEEDSIL